MSSKHLFIWCIVATGQCYCRKKMIYTMFHIVKCGLFWFCRVFSHSVFFLWLPTTLLNHLTNWQLNWSCTSLRIHMLMYTNRFFSPFCFLQSSGFRWPHLNALYRKRRRGAERSGWGGGCSTTPWLYVFGSLIWFTVLNVAIDLTFCHLFKVKM